MGWTTNDGFTAGHVLLAVAGGAALGVAIGVLVAPQSGAQTRADILRRATAAKKQARRLEHDVVDALEDTRDAVAHSVAEGMAGLKRQVHA